MKRLDLAGKVFGNLTVVGFSHSHVQPSGQKRAMWDVVCSCGNKKKVSTSNLTHGNTISCGCVGRKKRIEALSKPPGHAAKNSLFLSYKNSAKNRGIFFNLTKEEFFNVAVGRCVYCGMENPQIHKGKYKDGFSYCGVDRVSSSDGYVEGNVVTCCGVCNKMKNSYDIEFFINHIKRIYENAT